MRLSDFENMIRGMEREVPLEFLDGIESIEVTNRTIPHPLRRDVYTMGECVPELVQGEGVARLRSSVLLHYGSFAALARITPGFDWRHEAWETLTHELRHHLEWRASVPALEALDDACEANYARHDGEPFPALFFLDGERVHDGVTKVEDDTFIDDPVSGDSWDRVPGSERLVSWHGRRWSVTVPAETGDILYLALEGLEPEPAGDVVLVLRRKPGARDLWRAPVVRTESARVSFPSA